MGRKPLRRRWCLPRLWGQLCRPCLEKSHHVLPELDLGECPPRARNRHLQPITTDALIEDPLQSRSPNYRTSRRLAEDQEPRRRAKRWRLQPKCKEGQRRIWSRPWNEPSGFWGATGIRSAKETTNRNAATHPMMMKISPNRDWF